MKHLISILIVTVFAGTSWGLGGETQNGAGAAEQSFAYALTLLKPLYLQCLATESCLRTPAQKAVLQMIYENMDAELKNGTPLRFVPGSENFKIDGQVRIAYTDIRVGTLIYINQDLIYSKKEGQIIPYTVGEAIAVLTHELGHHTPLLGEHDFLDSLGANVRAFFEQEKQEVLRETYLDTLSESKISLSLIHSQNSESTSRMWLNVDSQIINLDGILKQNPGNGIRFFDLHWSEDIRPLGKGLLELAVEGQALISSQDNTVSITARYRVKIYFVFAQVTRNRYGYFEYVPNSARLEIREYK